MKKFCLNIAVFLIPLFIFLAPPLYVFYHSGEYFNDLDSSLQDGQKNIIGYFNEKNYRYMKWKKLMLNKRYTVVALGSSRVLQFRENMFQGSFYNAGYTISNIEDFVPFLKSIPKEKHPKYLIVNLDQWMFNKNWDEITTIKDSTFWTEAFHKNPKIKDIITTWQDLISKKYSLSLSNHTNGLKYIGLNACVNQVGFRNDGSMLYGCIIRQKMANDTTGGDYNFKDTFSRIKQDRLQFKYGKTINPKAITELENLLAYCKENNIYLVAFLPPFADAVNQKMGESKKYVYQDSLYQQCSPIFKKYAFELYDFHKLKQVNSNDTEVIDGFHGGEVTYTKLLLQMLNSGSKLNEVCDKDKIYDNLNHRINRYMVYKY